ncbi:MAG: DUF3619 family protein [Methylotenera sp.]|nr:DUF3619 family protein [Methylotenera sp.]MSP99561.1 DUF3619 family protein [Methylotenera sp.]
MSINGNMSNNKGDIHQLEANLTADEQVAYVAADLLNADAQHLNAVTLHRLSVARDLAVNRLTGIQTQAVSPHGLIQSGNVLQWLGGGCGAYFEQHRRLSSFIIAIVVMSTFFAVQQFNFESNLEHSDAFLLAAELPPEAFADKGFDTWLDFKPD